MQVVNGDAVRSGGRRGKEMPDLDCDTLGLATLRTAASIGHDDSFIWIGRSQATTRVSLALRSVRRLWHFAAASASEGGDEVPDCVSDAGADRADDHHLDA